MNIKEMIVHKETALSQSALSESQLRRWLIHEDVYLSRHTREWLENTPPEVASEMLARIAQDAALESAHPLAIFLRGFVLAGFAPSMAILGGNVYDRKAGIRAAILLGRRGDVRALAPLMRLWTDKAASRSKYHDDIEAILTHLLSRLEPNQAPPFAAEIRDLMQRVWKSGGPRDLSPARAALLIAALRALARDNDAETVALRDALRNPVSAKVHRKQVQEAAIAAANP